MSTTPQPNKKLLILENIVKDMGGTVDHFVTERNCYYVSLNGKQLLLRQHISIARNSFSTALSTKYKEITYKLLKAKNIPTPKTVAFYSRTFSKLTALEKLSQLTYPVILKDAGGSNSIGIVLNIMDPMHAYKVLKKNLSRHGSMIAQEMVTGREYRVMVLGEEVIGALEMVHPYVVGDGISSVKQLIRVKQANTKLRSKLNRSLKETLKGQGLSLSSIPAEGQTVVFKRHSCLAEGGETHDVTNLVHDDVRKLCVEASKAVGKYLVGIDVMCNDISKKPTSKTFNILEINGKPDLYIHHEPTHGKPRNVLKKILTFLTELPTTK